MKTAYLVLAAWLALTATHATAERLAIRNVHLVDARSTSPIPDKTVIIDGERIVQILKASERASVDRIIDGAGGFLIPGLWDMHVHLQHIRPESLSQFVHYGVTQVRDMGITPEGLDAIDKLDRSIRPEVFSAGFMLNSARWSALFSQVYSPAEIEQEMDRRIIVESAEQAVNAVQRVRDSGADLIKVHFWHDQPAIFRAIADQADDVGLPIAIHDPGPAFDYEALAAAGIDSLEHIDGMLSHRLRGLSATERARIYRALADAGVHFTPTLSMIEGLSKLPDGADPAVRLEPLRVHPEGIALDVPLEEFWLSVMKMIPPEAPDWSLFAGDLQYLIEARTHGVRILPGTDLGVPGVFPGVGLLTELKLLVEHLKLTPHEAITAATLTPAEWFGLEDTIGTIEPGKRANLVLLEHDPTQDIHALDSIVHVVLAGSVAR